MPDARNAPNEAALWVGLSLVPGLGGQGLRELLRRFGAPENIYAASHVDLVEVVSAKVARHIIDGPDPVGVAATLTWLDQENNHLITLADAEYPSALLEIQDPPPLLYAKGNLKWLNAPAIAVIGSRNATPQGEKNAEDFAHALSDVGYCVVSGLALGIDGAAHRGGLLGRASTIAVVGTGLDIVYPARHHELAHGIAELGLMLSEFVLGTPAMGQNFPRRNRIISGLSLGCLVVEANLQSGSLITARLAAEQGREVFAIPGSIHSPVAKGCHQLIKQGAKLVDSVADILEELGSAPVAAADAILPTGAPHPLLLHMGFDPVSIDSLAMRSCLTSENLSAMLTMLELEGRVACLPGGRYQRIV